MNQHKIQLYEKDNGRKFPEYKSLVGIEADRVIKSVCNLVGVKEQRLIFEKIIESSNCLPGLEEDFTYKLSEIISDLNFPLSEETHIIWDVDNIDVLNTNDILALWTDIYFPPADEGVLLYNLSKKKYIYLTHWENVYYN